MDLNAFLNDLRSKSIEEKGITIRQAELSKAFNGDVIPTLDEYSAMTVELLKLSTDDRKYYKEFYNNLIEKHDASLVFKAVDDAGKKEEYQFNKFQIIDAMEWAKDNNKLTQDEIEKYKLLKMSVEFRNFVEKYQNEKTCTVIEGDFVTVPASSFIELMTMNEASLKEVIKNNSYKEQKLDYVVFALDDFLENKKILDKYYIPKNVDNNLSILKSNIDITYINRCLAYEVNYIRKVEVNEKLKEAVLSDMPDYFDNLEKAFYVYYKLCTVLSYDDRYFAKRSMNEKREHQFFERLQTITPENNVVICYEFNSLYARMLKDLGIIYELNGSNQYADGHVSITFRADKFMVNADSTIGMIKSDLAYAKNGLILTGFTLENENEKTKQEFEQKVDKVYDYLRSKESVTNNYKGTVRELTYLEEALPDDLSLDEKVAIFISMTKDSTLKVMDKIPYEIKLSKILFDKGNKDDEQFQINYVSYQPDMNSSVHKTTKILTYNDKGIKNTKSNNYIFIDNNYEMHKTSLGEIKQELYRGRIRGLLRDDHIIPGTTLDEMNGVFNVSDSRSKMSIMFDTLNKINDYNNGQMDTRKAHR